MSMDILYVSGEGEMAGAEVSLSLLVREVRRRYAVGAAQPGGGELERRMRALGVRCFGVPRQRFGVRTAAGALEWGFRNLRMAELLWRNPGCAVHANNADAAAICVLPCAAMGRKMIWHVRDMRMPGWFVRIAGRVCVRMIAVSAAARRRCAELGAAEEKMAVVYNGADAEEKEQREKMGTGFVFSNIGQFAGWKNQAMFLRTARRVFDVRREARFLLVGGRVFLRNSVGYERKLLRMIGELGLEGVVERMEWRREMGEVWRRTDCVVHTAREEAFGRVVLEALGRGKAVIAMRGGGPAEILDGGRAGSLVSNEEELAEAMVGVMDDAGWRERMRARGIARAREFSAEATARGVMRIYEDVLKGERR